MKADFVKKKATNTYKLNRMAKSNTGATMFLCALLSDNVCSCYKIVNKAPC